MNAPLYPNWHGPLDPSAKLHEAARYFTNWSITAERGVHVALHHRGLPDVRVATLADVARLTRRELLASYGIGPLTVGFVERLLDRAGLALAPDAALEGASDEALMETLPARSGRPVGR